MSTKVTTFIHPSEAYTEDVLKCIKETIKKYSSSPSRPYQATKTAARNEQTFVTCVLDADKAWRVKFERRKDNLSRGFFADKTKPYQTVGTVYLEAGDLVLESITEELKSKITKHPRHASRDSNIYARKTLTQHKKSNALTTSAADRSKAREISAGFSAIKDRIEEVKEMKRGVLAEQTLGGYFVRKRNREQDVVKRDPSIAAPPEGRNWAIVRAVGRLMAGARPDEGDERFMSGVSPGMSKVLRRSKRDRTSTVTRLQKPLMGGDLQDLEENEKVLIRWRKAKRFDYVIAKLKAINAIFCAIFNMKAKLIKLNHPLSYKAVQDLLRSDITLDVYGKPSSWKATQHTVAVADETTPAFQREEGGSTPENTPDNLKPNSAQFGAQKKKPSSATVLTSTNNKSKLSKLVQVASRYGGKGLDLPGPKIETWEDLLNAGERRISLTMHKYSQKRRRDTVTQVCEAVAPWMCVSQAEKLIIEKKRTNLTGIVVKRTAEDVLEDIRADFFKLQKKLNKTMEDECYRQRMEQYKLIKCKFNTISLGPIRSIALETMRQDAKLRTRDRKDSSAKPLKWFSDLKIDMNLETDGRQNEEINDLLLHVSRFQYDDDKTMPFAKEKVCLLVMSMPAHMLLTASMTDAVIFILDKVLGSPSELLQYWLTGRKLDKISNMLRYQYRPKSRSKA